MIIKIQQVKTGLKINYEVSGTHESYLAKAPAFQDTGNILLTDPKENLWELKYKVPPIIGKTSSLGISFGFQHRLNEFYIKKNDLNYGMITYVRYEKVKSRYELEWDEDKICLFPLLQGAEEILLVFQGDTQIAHIKRETRTIDLKDCYFIYLPDEFSARQIPMILFVLYYDHCEHGNRGEFKKGSVQQSYGYSFGDANLRYDPKWLKKHFPNEYIVPLEINPEKSIALGKRLSIVQTVLTFVFFIVLALFLIFVVGDFKKALIVLVLFVIVTIFKNRHSVD